MLFPSIPSHAGLVIATLSALWQTFARPVFSESVKCQDAEGSLKRVLESLVVSEEENKWLFLSAFIPPKVSAREDSSCTDMNANKRLGGHQMLLLMLFTNSDMVGFATLDSELLFGVTFAISFLSRALLSFEFVEKIKRNVFI